MARNRAANDDLLDDDDDLEQDGIAAARAEGEDAVDDEFAGLDSGEVADAVEDGATGGTETEETVDELDQSAEDLLDPEDDDEAETPRNADGTFAPKKDEKGEKGEKVVDAKTGTAAPAKDGAKPDAAAATGDGKPAADAKPADAPIKWEPLQLRVGKAIVPFEEARVADLGDTVGFVVKKTDVARFNQRLERGHLFETNRQAIEGRRRELDQGIKDLELERAAPQGKGETEIKAEIILEAVEAKLAETGDGAAGGSWVDLFTPTERELLKARIELAQKAEKERVGTERTTYFDTKKKEADAAAAPERDLQTQARGIIDETRTLRDEHPEFKAATDEQLMAALQELGKVRKSVYWKEGDDWFVNRELIAEALKRAMAAAPASTQTTDTKVAPSKPENTAAGASTDGKTTDATTRAEAHNRGVNTAKKPTSTSFKAQRDGGPRDERHTRSRDGSGKEGTREKSKAMAAEDSYRSATDKFMRSPDLDVDFGDEGG